MANVQPLRRKELPQYDDLFKIYEQQMGFVPNSFFTMARRPEILDAFRQLILTVWTTGTVDPQLKPLVALMTSYGAGCRYCQAHEVARSHQAGVSLDNIAASLPSITSSAATCTAMLSASRFGSPWPRDRARTPRPQSTSRTCDATTTKGRS